MGYVEELWDRIEKDYSLLECIMSSAYWIDKYRKNRMLESEDDTILYDVSYQPLRFPPGSQPPIRD